MLRACMEICRLSPSFSTVSYVLWVVVLPATTLFRTVSSWPADESCSCTRGDGLHLGCYPAAEGEEPTCFVADVESCPTVVGVRVGEFGDAVGWRPCPLEYEEETALFMAAKQNDAGAIRRLITRGVNVNALRGVLKNDSQSLPPSATHLAIQHGNFEAIETMLFSGGVPIPLVCNQSQTFGGTLCTVAESAGCKNAVSRSHMENLTQLILRTINHSEEPCHGPSVESASTSSTRVDDCHRFPYFASIRIPLNYAHVCGGVVVDDHYVLTAAHCVDPTASILGRTLPLVFIGGNKLDPEDNECGVDVLHFARVVDAILHPQWDHKFGSGFDLALLKLDRSVSTKIGNLSGDVPPEGTELSLVGFGRPSPHSAFSKALNQIKIDVQNKYACELVYGQAFNDNVLCLGGQHADFCEGDDGGPLFQDGGGSEADVLVGIAHRKLPSIPCGTSGLPGLFSAVSSSVVSWITETTKGNSERAD